jgi:peptide-methionine (S)-S-oxide reductase
MGQHISKSNGAAAVRAASPTAPCTASPTAPEASPTISNKVALGAGCYWGTEKYVQKNFQLRFPGSIKSTMVGFMSPDEHPRIKNPTYRDVCTGRSGHVEVLFVELNNPQMYFEELIRFFYCFHDPTTKNRQGNDTGFQYASYIFCGDEEQAAICEKVRNELQAFLDSNPRKSPYFNKKVTTKISPLMEFTKAEEYHQRYLEKNPSGYCNHRIRLKEWPSVDESKEDTEIATDEVTK